MYTVGPDGYLVGEDGNRVEIDGQHIQLKGMVSQETMDTKIMERIKRETEKNKRNTQALIDQYEEKLKNTSMTVEEREKLQKKVDELENQVLSADEIAAKKLGTQKKAHEEELLAARRQSDSHLQMYQNEHLSNQVLTAAARKNFLDPSDAVEVLTRVAQWEPVTDPDTGKKTGGWNLSFSMMVPSEKEGEDPVQKTLNAEQAVATLATSKPYLIRGSDKHGRGDDRGTSFNKPGESGDDNWRDKSPEKKMAGAYKTT